MLECVQWSTSLVNQYLFANFSTMNMLHIYEFYSQLFDGGVPSRANNRKLQRSDKLILNISLDLPEMSESVFFIV